MSIRYNRNKLQKKWIVITMIISSSLYVFCANAASKVTDKEFMPNNNIKRQDMAVILCNLAKIIGKNAEKAGKTFVDDSEISDYAKDAVSFLSSVGVVNGDENGAFNPHSFANRAEAAQMLYTFMQIIGEEVLN